MFVACGIWCIADVSSVSPSSEQFVGGGLLKHSSKCAAHLFNWSSCLVRVLLLIINK